MFQFCQLPQCFLYLGLIPYGGTKTPQAKWYGKKSTNKNKNHCTYINLIEMKENAITIRTPVGAL